MSREYRELLMERKIMGRSHGGGTRKLKARFGKVRRGLVIGVGRQAGAAYALQGRLKRAETHLGRRAKRLPPTAGMLKAQRKREQRSRQVRENADATMILKLRALRGHSAT